MTKITARTDVLLEGRGIISLFPKDHMASGGEGSIYKKNDTVIKLYSDPKKMHHDGMIDKITLLKQCRHPFIVVPDGVVFDKAKRAIGYYMPFASGEPMSRVFTNDYRGRTKFNDSSANVLVESMRKVVVHAHQNKAIMVDANELNWLVLDSDIQAPEPRAIDVDAWAIGRWGASVIMPSIRDWHTSNFNEQSDWFSWGIVTFQIYIGIHPYKGRLSGYKQQEMEQRMKDNASVFHKDVRLNNAVRDFGCIPTVLRKWYEDEFAKGKRTKPPSPFDVDKVTTNIGRTTHVQVLPGKNLLIYEKIFETNKKIVRLFEAGVALLADGTLVDIATGKTICRVMSKHIAISAQYNGWCILECDQLRVRCRFVNASNGEIEDLPISLLGHDVISAGNRLFVLTDNGLTEIIVMKMRSMIVSIGNTWPSSPYATKWFDGVGVEDVMGSMHLILPFGERACAIHHLKELDAKTPVAGSAKDRFVSIIALDKNGLYHKYEFYFASDFRSYTVWNDIVDNADLAIAILPKGVCATIVADGELDIFVPANGSHQKIADQMIKTGNLLSQLNNKVIYIDQNKIWKLSMK